MIKNIFANVIGRLWTFIATIIFIPLYIKYLGFENYSVITFSLVILSIITIMDGGLTSTLSREFARSDNDFKLKQNVFKTLESIYLLITFLIILIGVILSQSIADIWLGNSIINGGYLITLICVDSAFQLLFRFYLGGLFGLEYQIQANVLQILLGIFRSALVLPFIYYFSNIEAFFLWQCCCSFVFTIFIIFILNKKVFGSFNIKNLRISIDKKIVKAIWKFALGMALISVIAVINTQLDKLIISKILSVKILGYYYLAVSLSLILIAIANPVSIALLPRFTSLFSVGKNKEGQELFIISNKIVVILVSSVAAVFIFFPKEVIYMWTGDMLITENSYRYLPWLTVSATMLSIVVIPYNIAIANGYTKLNNILGILSIGITLPGYFLMVKSVGAVGVAITYAAVQTIITIVFFYFINKKYLKIPNSKLVKQILLPIGVAILLCYIFKTAISRLEVERADFLLLFSIFSGISLIINFIINVKSEQRKKLITQFKFKSKNGSYE